MPCSAASSPPDSFRASPARRLTLRPVAYGRPRSPTRPGPYAPRARATRLNPAAAARQTPEFDLGIATPSLSTSALIRLLASSSVACSCNVPAGKNRKPLDIGPQQQASEHRAPARSKHRAGPLPAATRAARAPSAALRRHRSAAPSCHARARYYSARLIDTNVFPSRGSELVTMMRLALQDWRRRISTRVIQQRPLDHAELFGATRRRRLRRDITHRRQALQIDRRPAAAATPERRRPLGRRLWTHARGSSRAAGRTRWTASSTSTAASDSRARSLLRRVDSRASQLRQAASSLFDGVQIMFLDARASSIPTSPRRRRRRADLRARCQTRHWQRAGAKH